MRSCPLTRLAQNAVPREALGLQHAGEHARLLHQADAVAIPDAPGIDPACKGHDFLDASQLAVVAALNLRCRPRDFAVALVPGIQGRCALDSDAPASSVKQKEGAFLSRR